MVHALLGLSKSNSSHHFRVLRESGIPRRSQRGSQQYAALRTLSRTASGRCRSCGEDPGHQDDDEAGDGDDEQAEA